MWGHGIVLAAAVLVSAAARADCLDDAAKFHGVSPLLLRGVAQWESRMNPTAVHRNKDGSEDIGLMQINSSHLPQLARWGISRAMLFDACVSAYVGAWILRDNIDRHGATWTAVGAYNARSDVKRMEYARHIYDTLQSISR
ncbi:lytic transglycosylase (plasmid) [Cupriavidus sp. USMAA2-4]|uniref:lytic transglycosylase domain-containing protein n=1 Tax=Cupriavidus sp. USMAA2-4 TaxID=876364 RepID=UPI0008A67E2F|nr:lytic transglycosylase domain-containing protein [Cupriavidus sp. USMAA2-4]AOY97708.1 lytic transglycosylase [Cupriavidus sp. USMAA2-4]